MSRPLQLVRFFDNIIFVWPLSSTFNDIIIQCMWKVYKLNQGFLTGEKIMWLVCWVIVLSLYDISPLPCSHSENNEPVRAVPSDCVDLFSID
jgi:hypothetical protein